MESPSGIVQSYKVYVAKYTHDYELIIWSNDELAERVGASAYERKTPLPFNVTKSNLRIGMADPSKGYQLSINGGPKQPITTATPQILTSVSLPAINNVIPITVYDKDGLEIKPYQLHISREVADNILGAIYVDGNKAEKVQDIATGEVYFEAYAYHAPSSGVIRSENFYVQIFGTAFDEL